MQNDPLGALSFSSAPDPRSGTIPTFRLSDSGFLGISTFVGQGYHNLQYKDGLKSIVEWPPFYPFSLFTLTPCDYAYIWSNYTSGLGSELIFLALPAFRPRLKSITEGLAKVPFRSRCPLSTLSRPALV
jgi:hypothetical protein